MIMDFRKLKLDETNLDYVGSVPASDCADLLALPTTHPHRPRAGPLGGLSACDTRRVTYGGDRRTIATHSPQLRDHQARGFAVVVLVTYSAVARRRANHGRGLTPGSNSDRSR